MKRLKRFNESKLEELDYDYIYQCFGELIDEDKLEVELIDRQVIVPYITLRLRTISKEARVTSHGNPIGNKKSPIYNYIDSYNQNNILLQELEVGLKRLSDKYPDYNLKFTDYGTSIFIEIHNELKKESYPF
jgi:hypothetical protein